jgi:hypothetical protein
MIKSFDIYKFRFVINNWILEVMKNNDIYCYCFKDSKFHIAGEEEFVTPCGLYWIILDSEQQDKDIELLKEFYNELKYEYN